MGSRTDPSDPPRAREADWYNRHYRQIQAIGPWYRFAIPELVRHLQPSSRLVELGCGQGHLLRFLVEQGLVPEENLFAIDQSQTAIAVAQSRLPRAHVLVGDIYRLDYEPDFFDVCVMMEVIEHLADPAVALAQVHSVMKPGGLLFLSFPNYLSLPWLPVRILAEKLNHPNWILLQPIDKIYFVPGLIRLLARAGFEFQTATGSIYGPPLLYRWERDWMTRALNALRLWRLAFHPILVFKKR